MSDRGKIIAIYSGVAVLSAIILAVAIHLSNQVPPQPEIAHPAGAQEHSGFEGDVGFLPPDIEVFAHSGAETAETFFPIVRDLEGVTQAGEAVKLSDLKGKVWIVSEFFAVCPHCATRNGQELKGIYEEFKDHPDFRMVCVSVDPENDSREHLQAIGGALGADPKNWWFFNAGDERKTHEYMEKTLRFFAIQERKDPLDIKSNGRFAHDLGIVLVDREWNVVGKWPLATARSEQNRKLYPGLYEDLKKHLYDRIMEELEKNETVGTETLDEEPADPPAADE